MATMQRKAIAGPGKPKKEKGYQIPGKYNKAGKEIFATRKGISQVDRTSASENNSPTTREVPLIGGGISTQSYKSKYGNSDYPSAIANLSKKTNLGADKSTLNASERGKRESLARLKQEYETEKMGRVKSNYSEPKRGNARGNETFVKRTVSDPEQASGKFTSINAEADKAWGANKRFTNKKTGEARTRKNLLGRTVTKTKTAEFGAVVKGSGSKSKQIGDKVIKKTRTVAAGSGVPFLSKERKGKGYGKTVSRVGTSTKKNMERAGEVRGGVSNSKLGKNTDRSDVKTRVFKSHRVVTSSKRAK